MLTMRFALRANLTNLLLKILNARSRIFTSEPDRIRTCDQELKRLLLYR